MVRNCGFFRLIIKVFCVEETFGYSIESRACVSLREHTTVTPFIEFYSAIKTNSNLETEIAF